VPLGTEVALGEVMAATEVIRASRALTPLLPESGSLVVAFDIVGVPPPDFWNEQVRLGVVDEL
jgi:hypothetical protein